MRNKIIIFITSIALLCSVSFAGAESYLAENLYGVNFMDIVAMAAGKDRLVLRNSTINLNFGDFAPMPIELQGFVVFVLPDMPGLGDHILLSGISGGCCVFVQTGFSEIFDTKTWLWDNSLMISVYRITDYEQILGNAKGRFINSMRVSGENSELLSRLDDAKSMAELKSVMDNSVALNPAKLMEPVNISMLFNAPVSQGGATGSIDIMVGDGLILSSAAAGGGIKNDFLSLGASIRAGEFSKSGIEEFSGVFYGLDIHGRIYSGIFYAASMIGVVFADFQTGALHDGDGGAAYNPKGTAVFGNMELGAKAFDDGAFHITPIIRADMFSSRVLSDSNSEIFTGLGARAGYKKTVMGIESSYGVYGIAMQSGKQFGIRKDIRAPRDGLAVHLDAGVLDIHLGRFYKFSGGVKLDF